MKGTNLKESVTSYVKSIPKAVANATLDLLENSDFISRSVGMNNSYEDIMSLIQGLGREPISLLGKDYSSLRFWKAEISGKIIIRILKLFQTIFGRE